MNPSIDHPDSEALLTETDFYTDSALHAHYRQARYKRAVEQLTTLLGVLMFVAITLFCLTLSVHIHHEYAIYMQTRELGRPRFVSDPPTAKQLAAITLLK